MGEEDIGSEMAATIIQLRNMLFWELGTVVRLWVGAEQNCTINAPVTILAATKRGGGC